MNKVIFIGAGPGDPELITVKAQQILKSAKVILYTGSLVSKEILCWAPEECLIESSQNMTYQEIFNFIEKHINHSDVIRLHTGDPSIYSTIAKQMSYLKEKTIPYEIIPGVTAAFGAAASLGIEFTIPGVSQTLIISRLEGNTPNPERMETILNCRHSSHVFYLSASLINRLVEIAIKTGYSPDTPCWVIEKATWPTEKYVKGSLNDIIEKVKNMEIKQTAVIMLGDYLNQQETEESHLYNILSSS